MEYLLNLLFVVVLVCIITFFGGIIKLFTNKNSKSTALKMILFSVLIVVIILIIGVSVCVSNFRIGGIH